MEYRTPLIFLKERWVSAASAAETSRFQYIDYERLGPGFQGREKDFPFIAEYDCFVTVLKNHILEKFILFT